MREGEIFLHDARRRFRPDNLVRPQAVERDKPAVIHDPLELPDRFEELRYRFLVLDLLRDNLALAQRAERAFLTAAHLGCLGKEQVAEVIQERAFVKMPFKRAGQETKLVLVNLRLVLLFDEEVLFMYDGKSPAIPSPPCATPNVSPRTRYW